MQDREWLYYVERSGRAGCEWSEQFRRHSPTMQVGHRALLSMREGRLEQGAELLQELIREVEGICGEPDSIRAVLDRYRYGIEGYYFYCRNEFALAEQSMRLAHDAIARALSTADWLLLLATHCQEFCLHQARIARNQHHWPKMQACIAEARAMMNDRIPLCETEDGKKIWWSSLQPFFDALMPLTDEETRFANTLLNKQERERLFDQFVRGMLRSSSNNGKHQ